jgi:hypothetical protein
MRRGVAQAGHTLILLAFFLSSWPIVHLNLIR